MILDLLTAVVLVAVGVRLVRAARIGLRRRDRVAFIVKGVRWRHVWPVPLVLTGVLTVAVALVQIPGLDLGWWTLLGGTGNPVTGTSDRTTGSVLEWLVPAVFLVLLVPALPLLAEAEERVFRRGAERWSTRHRAAMALRFGLVHAIVGIPIGVAVALSVGGGYFTICYLRGWRRAGGSIPHTAIGPIGAQEAGVLESTRAHFTYNAVLLSLLAVYVVTVAAGAG